MIKIKTSFILLLVKWYIKRKYGISVEISELNAEITEQVRPKDGEYVMADVSFTVEAKSEEIHKLFGGLKSAKKS